MNRKRERRADWAAAVLWRSPRLRASLLRMWLWLRITTRSAAAVGAAGVVFSLNGPFNCPFNGQAGDPAPRSATIAVVDGEVAVADNGLCSLIEAIHNANDTTDGALYADCAAGDPAGGDVLLLPPAGEFILTAADNETYGPTGLPVITSEVTISGSYISVIRRDESAEPFRILAVGRDGRLSVNWSQISGGRAEAAPERRPQVDYATSGGGILNLGQLNLGEAVISGNTAVVGGGVYNAGELTGHVHLIDNDALYGGDALLSFGDARLNWIDARQNGSGPFSVAVQNEGVMELAGGYIRDNEAYTGLLNRGALTVYELVFEGGHTAIANEGELTVEAATLRDNVTGLANSFDARVWRTAIVDNGRGIHNSGGTLSLINSTISGNRNNDVGGGVLVTGGRVDGYFNTITDNEAGRGGGAFVAGSYTEFYDCIAGFMGLRNSILSGNRAEDGREAYVEQDSFRCLGHLYLDGSLVGHDGDHGTVNSILGHATVPDEPLSAIISPEWTYSADANPHHPLPWGSPAIDALPNAACELSPPFYASDQLFNERNVDGDYRPSERECDAGAVERQLMPYRSFAPFAARVEVQP